MPVPAGMFFTATLLRATGGSWDHGRFTPGTDSTSDIMASIQAIPGEVLNRLPETVRAQAAYLAITRERLRTTAQAGQLEADRIVYLGETFGVVEVGWWPFLDLAHGEYVLIRKEPVT